MTAEATTHHRSFLDGKEAETAVDLDALKNTLTEAVRGADKLGLLAVKEHLDAALAGVAEQPGGELKA